MQIETDRSAIFAKEKIIGREGVGLIIVGSCRENEIKLIPDYPIQLISSYCHEVGHFMGEKYSFKERNIFNRRKTKNIMTFDEIKGMNISVDLDKDELVFMKAAVNGRKGRASIGNESLSIANKLLAKFFRGKFNFDDIWLYMVKDMKITKKTTKDVPSIKPKGKRCVTVNTRAVRDTEIPSIATEVGCSLILENTLRKYGLIRKKEYIDISRSPSPSHQRAQNIVARAFMGTGWTLPSTVDLERK